MIEAIQHMTDVNAKGNMMARNTGAQLEDMIKQLMIMNQNLKQPSPANPSNIASGANQGIPVSGLVPSQVINSSQNGNQGSSGQQQLVSNPGPRQQQSQNVQTNNVGAGPQQLQPQQSQTQQSQSQNQGGTQSQQRHHNQGSAQQG